MASLGRARPHLNEAVESYLVGRVLEKKTWTKSRKKKNNFNNADTMRRVGRCANTDGDDAACDGYRFSTQITGEFDNIGLESSLLR